MAAGAGPLWLPPWEDDRAYVKASVMIAGAGGWHCQFGVGAPDPAGAPQATP